MDHPTHCHPTELAAAYAELAAALRGLAEAARTVADRAPRDPDALLDAEELGALLKLPARTVKDQAASNRIPHRRFGKHYRFSQHDAEHIVQQAARTATTAKQRSRAA